MKRWWILKAVKILVLITVVALGLGYLLMTLWNNLIPQLFNGPVITFGQALGLFLLSRILFMGFRPWGGGQYARGSWKSKWEEKMAAMTPEERERFKQACAKRFSSRWCREQSPAQEKMAANEVSM
jgi:hypothetical protein